MPLTMEWLAILEELNHKSELQRILAAVYLFNNLPMREMSRLTKKQIGQIAAPTRPE